MGFITNLELGASTCIHIHWFLIWPGCEGGPGAIAHHEPVEISPAQNGDSHV